MITGFGDDPPPLWLELLEEMEIYGSTGCGIKKRANLLLSDLGKIKDFDIWVAKILVPCGMSAAMTINDFGSEQPQDLDKISLFLDAASSYSGFGAVAWVVASIALVFLMMVWLGSFYGGLVCDTHISMLISHRSSWHHCPAFSFLGSVLEIAGRYGGSIANPALTEEVVNVGAVAWVMASTAFVFLMTVWLDSFCGGMVCDSYIAMLNRFVSIGFVSLICLSFRPSWVSGVCILQMTLCLGMDVDMVMWGVSGLTILVLALTLFCLQLLLLP